MIEEDWMTILGLQTHRDELLALSCKTVLWNEPNFGLGWATN
jgi:hypothetical protein